MNKIKKWQDAFKAKGLDPKVMPDVSMLPVQYRKQQIALFILTVVAEVLNGDWKPDYANTDQWKYEPWFEVVKSGSGFALAYCDYDYWFTITFCGARLCFKDRATAEYAARTFIKLYEDLYLPVK